MVRTGRYRCAGLLAGVGLMVSMPFAAASVTADTPSPTTMLFQANSKDLKEASGIATDPTSSLFFVNQDAGDPADIYVLNLTGRVRALIHLTQLNEDWEDIASGIDSQGKPVLHIADTGDAFLVRKAAGLPARREFAIIQVDQPRLDPLGPTIRINATNVKRFRFGYSDGKSHNAETLLVRPRSNWYFVADKTQKPEQPAYLWAGPESPSQQTLNKFTLVGAIPVTGASGGAFSPGGDRMVIRNGAYAFIWHVTGANVAEALAHPPVTISLPAEKQGEGICFAADGRSLVINSEGRNGTVWQVGLPQEAQSKVPPQPAPDAVVGASPDKRLDQSAMLISGTAAVGVLTLVGLMGLRRRQRRT